MTSDKKALEEGLAFKPRFGADGLLPCIVTSAIDGEVLMFAYMNQDALAETIATGRACYWSRSRQSLWRKGESSGNSQKVIDMRIDCDQDCLWITVEMPAKDEQETACHTGRRGCFYRRIGKSGSGEPILEFI